VTTAPRRDPFLRSCRLHLCDRPALRRCLAIAAAVGTILSLVNQGDLILEGGFTAATAAKLAMNYLVPFVVSSLGYISARRRAAAPG
jgi:hypothetical protein